MKAVENAVSAMDDAVSFSAYLEELGRRHIARSLKPSYLDVSSLSVFIYIFKYARKKARFCKVLSQLIFLINGRTNQG